MRRLLVVLLLVPLTSYAGSVASPPAGADAAGKPVRLTGPPDARPGAVDYLLAEYTFDNGALPDPQGWTSADRQAQPRRFHIDDFAGLAPGYTPLAGSRSLWCGTAAEYATPGYGNAWRQAFRSDILTVTGDVTVEFLVRYDMEANYDRAYLEYDPDPSAGTENWQVLQSYTGGPTGPVVSSNTINGGLLPNGQVRLRFRFESDGGYSDEDGFYNSVGAIVIDNLTVSDGSGLINSQDFESEMVGETGTADGTWEGFDLTGFGDYAALHGGSGVLQQGCCANTTHLWGFFVDPAVANYGCAGFPAQGVVPYGNATDGWIDNEIRSPVIPYTGAGQLLNLEFEVYRDLPTSANIYYRWNARFYDGVAWTNWVNDNLVYYGPDADWFVHTQELLQHCPIPEPTITHVQVALGVIDMCPIYGGSCQCHSNGPLFDNVRVYRSDGAVPVAIQKFNAKETGRGVELNWQLYADEEIAGIEVYRRDPGKREFVPLQGATPLPASIRSMVDETVEPATTYEYTLKVLTAAGGEFVSGIVQISTSALELALEQNEPNPFNPVTTIRFSLDRSADVQLAIYDVSGRIVRTLVRRPLASGLYSETWDGTDDRGARVSSGLYFYRLDTGRHSITRKMVLLK